MMDYKKIYSWLSKSSYQGINGVYVIEGEAKGVTLGVTVMTHGNEPSGLAAADFIKNYFAENSLPKGRIFLVLNNIKAGGAYLNATSLDEKRKARFIDVNMNRLPRNFLECDDGYEVQRAKELLPIWEKFDVGFDIHSTSTESEPMIIQRSAKDSTYTSSFPIENVLTNIFDVQLGVPAAALYGANKNSYAFAIESGQHESPDGSKRVIDCTKSLLTSLGMARFEVDCAITQKIYKVVSSVVIPSLGYKFLNEIPCFSTVKKGTVIAQNKEGDEIILDDDYIALLAPPVGNILYTTEETMFLAKEISEFR